ncbi:hypothetical protein pb186bvf_018694 [Paramecium bursaria]
MIIQEITYSRMCSFCQALRNIQGNLNVTECDNDNSFVAPPDISADESQIIFPCLCNMVTHRYCLKQQILKERIFQCKICEAPYQSQETQRIYAQQSLRDKQNQVILKVLLNLSLIIVVALVIYYIRQIDSYAISDKLLSIFAYIFAGLCALLSIIYTILIKIKNIRCQTALLSE